MAHIYIYIYSAVILVEIMFKYLNDYVTVTLLSYQSLVLEHIENKCLLQRTLKFYVSVDSEALARD